MNKQRSQILIILSLLIILAVIAGCSANPTLEPHLPKSRQRLPAPTDLPQPPFFIEGDCRFNPPNIEVICGDLFVLQDRADPASRLVSLHVAIFPSYAPDPEPDPVIYLMGGGGGDSLGAASFYVGAVGNKIRVNRDFILYNQRGVKRNDPYLTCPGEEDFYQQLTSLMHPDPEADQLEYNFLMDCRDHFREQGIDLDLYDSVTHAQDLVDLIQVLGYEDANIYGTSYGTRLGLTVMRHHPEVIRSAILDAVLPPQINFPSDAITSYVNAVEALFSACAAQESCAEEYPDLEADFYQTIDTLKAEPVTLNVDGEDVLLDHIMFMDVVYMLLHPAAAVPETPWAIHNAALGEYSGLKDAVRSILSYSDFVATGVQYSSMCKDEVNFDSLENSLEISSQYREIWGEYFDLAYFYQICQDWIIEGADEIENTPVESDLPTLLMSGTFDSVTPPAWAEDTVSYLENSYHYEFPNMAHGTVRYDACALSIALDFLNDPGSEPDASCLDELGYPEFK
jgi:pimeloyl-ACP methyl ester carboxylesterase